MNRHQRRALAARSLCVPQNPTGLTLIKVGSYPDRHGTGILFAAISQSGQIRLTMKVCVIGCCALIRMIKSEPEERNMIGTTQIRNVLTQLCKMTNATMAAGHRVSGSSKGRIVTFSFRQGKLVKARQWSSLLAGLLNGEIAPSSVPPSFATAISARRDKVERLLRR